MATTKEQERFRLRNMKVTRVDLVDRGANQEAHIKLAKNEKEGYPEDDDKKSKKSKSNGKSKSKSNGDLPKPGQVKVSGETAKRIREVLAEKENGEENGKEEETPKAEDKKPGRSPLGRPKGDQQRIVRIRPEDFEVTEVNGNMMEWAIPEDKLPEGVEEAIMSMAQSAETVMFQWMIDPLAGPPVEGQAKTAAEAFMAMRAALTNQGAMDPAAMLGGLPGEMGGGNPAAGGMNPAQQPGQPAPNQKDKTTSPMAKAIKQVRAQRAATQVAKTAEETLDDTLDLIVKGLVEVDVFNETATGRDLRDILPANLLAELTNQLSATTERRVNHEETQHG